MYFSADTMGASVAHSGIGVIGTARAPLNERIPPGLQIFHRHDGHDPGSDQLGKNCASYGIVLRCTERVHGKLFP